MSTVNISVNAENFVFSDPSLHETMKLLTDALAGLTGNFTEAYNQLYKLREQVLAEPEKELRIQLIGEEYFGTFAYGNEVLTQEGHADEKRFQRIFSIQATKLPEGYKLSKKRKTKTV